MCNNLDAMWNRSIPSITGRVTYKVTKVRIGESVELESPTRKQPSVLRWEDIRTVSHEGSPDLNTVEVDNILGNPQYRDSSTMCALVLAMRDPTRVR